jgi:hypothetical protein
MMNVLPELDALLELQRRDSLLMEARRRRDEIPKRREALRTALASAKAALDRGKKDLDAAKVGRRGCEKEAEAFQAEIAKLEKQLLDVKTNQEYTAMRHQIEGVKGKRSDVETKILESYDREESLAASVAASERRVSEEEARLKQGEAALDREAADLEQSLEALARDRDTMRPQVPSAVLTRYDRLGSVRDGIAVVEVKKGACAACFKSLTPHAMQEVRRRETIMNCESCGRILIFNEGNAV